MTSHHNTLVFGHLLGKHKIILALQLYRAYLSPNAIFLNMPERVLTAVPDSKVSKSLFVSPVHLGAFLTLAAI